jgi:hypothetical protein
MLGMMMMMMMLNDSKLRKPSMRFDHHQAEDCHNQIMVHLPSLPG